MAQITYRANLSAKSFPFISDNWGRTIIVPQYDNTFNRQVSSDADADKDVGIPQVYYCHNVMPNAQGFQSVGYTTILSAASGVSTFTSIYLLRDSDDSKVYLGVTSSNQFYVNSGTGWVLKGTYGTAGATVTVAFVSGVTYIYIASYGCLKYNFSTGLFTSVTLAGLEVTKIQGITSAVGYLIAWSSPVAAATLSFTTVTDSQVITGASTTGIVLNQSVSGVGIPEGAYVTDIVPGVSVTLSEAATAPGTVSVTFGALPAPIAWSSTIDPTDFYPSLITGAGGGAVEGARGAITLCVALTLGFIIYTTNNAVSAVYANSVRYPFNFREILSSGGVASQDLVGIEANSGNHYAYTTSGFQIISSSQAQTVFAEMTDFIAGKLFEDYDENTDTFNLTILTSAMKKKVSIIADRYVIISYGVSSLTHALVYDSSQKRFGKLKIPHVATIEYQLPAAGITEIPKQSVGFLQADGTLKVVDFSAYSSGSYGVVALGKYQFVRQRMMQLDTIAIENIFDQSTLSCRILSAVDGKNATASVPTTLISSGRLRTFGSRAEGINHSIVLKGNYQLESLVLQFSLHGKR